MAKSRVWTSASFASLALLSHLSSAMADSPAAVAFRSTMNTACETLVRTEIEYRGIKKRYETYKKAIPVAEAILPKVFSAVEQTPTYKDLIDSYQKAKTDPKTLAIRKQHADLMAKIRLIPDEADDEATRKKRNALYDELDKLPEDPLYQIDKRIHDEFVKLVNRELKKILKKTPPALGKWEFGFVGFDHDFQATKFGVLYFTDHDQQEVFFAGRSPEGMKIGSILNDRDSPFDPFTPKTEEEFTTDLLTVEQAWEGSKLGPLAPEVEDCVKHLSKGSDEEARQNLVSAQSDRADSGKTPVAAAPSATKQDKAAPSAK